MGTPKFQEISDSSSCCDDRARRLCFYLKSVVYGWWLVQNERVLTHDLLHKPLLFLVVLFILEYIICRLFLCKPFEQKLVFHGDLNEFPPPVVSIQTLSNYSLLRGLSRTKIVTWAPHNVAQLI